MRKLTAGIFPDSAAARFISSPDDLDTHYARKYSSQWVGYKVHLTETCDDVTLPLITHVLTTTAPIDDSKATASIHAALETKDLLPRCHIVDAGYVDAELLAVSQRDYAIDLCGVVRGVACAARAISASRKRTFSIVPVPP